MCSYRRCIFCLYLRVDRYSHQSSSLGKRQILYQYARTCMPGLRCIFTDISNATRELPLSIIFTFDSNLLMSVSVIFIAPFSTVNPTPLYSPVEKWRQVQ